jgi:hypothetical protein
MRERRHTFRVLTRDLLSRPPNIETIDVILHQNFPIGLHVMYLYFPDTLRIQKPKYRTSVPQLSKRMLCTVKRHDMLNVPQSVSNTAMQCW